MSPKEDRKSNAIKVELFQVPTRVRQLTDPEGLIPIFLDSFLGLVTRTIL